MNGKATFQSLVRENRSDVVSTPSSGGTAYCIPVRDNGRKADFTSFPTDELAPESQSLPRVRLTHGLCSSKPNPRKRSGKRNQDASAKGSGTSHLFKYVFPGDYNLVQIRTGHGTSTWARLLILPRNLVLRWRLPGADDSRFLVSKEQCRFSSLFFQPCPILFRTSPHEAYGICIDSFLLALSSTLVPCFP